MPSDKKKNKNKNKKMPLQAHEKYMNSTKIFEHIFILFFPSERPVNKHVVKKLASISKKNLALISFEIWP